MSYLHYILDKKEAIIFESAQFTRILRVLSPLASFYTQLTLTTLYYHHSASIGVINLHLCFNLVTLVVSMLYYFTDNCWHCPIIIIPPKSRENGDHLFGILKIKK